MYSPLNFLRSNVLQIVEDKKSSNQSKSGQPVLNGLTLVLHVGEMKIELGFILNV